MRRIVTLPDRPNIVEIARLTTRTGYVLMIAYAEGLTYGYVADGARGFGLTLADVCRQLNDVREWPGGKTATFTGIRDLFQQEI